MNYDFQQRDQLEDVILGILLIDSSSEMKKVFERHGVMSPENFRTKFNQDVFATILKLWEQQLPVDLVTVCAMRPEEYRNKKDINWSNNFEINCITLTQKISSSAHLEVHLLLLKEYILIDYWNNKANDILEGYWDNRSVLTVADNIIEGYQQLLDNFNKNNLINNGNKDLKTAAQEKFDKMQKGEVVTVPIGVPSIQTATNGWQPSELTIMGARPGMGKSTIALIIAKSASFDYKKKGLFISLEMTKTQLMNRLIAEQMELEYDDIKNFKLSKEQFAKVLNWYDYFETKSNLKIYDINDCRTLGKIIEKIELEKPEFVIIDYLQLIKLDKQIQKGSNREQEVSEISRNLKLTALEFDIPLIALSQLSRSCEARNNKRPMLSDLRESGSIEQDADNVIFFYRDAYYRKLVGEIVPTIEESNVEWIWAKGREAPIDTYRIHINPKTHEILDEFQYNGVEVALPPPPPK